MSVALWAVGIALFGLPPTVAHTAQLRPLVDRGPRLTAHDLMTTTFWEPENGRISKMHRLIELTPDDDPQKPDFFFRLGEACEWWWRHERRQSDAGGQRRATAYFSEAIDAYRAASTYKKYDRIDGALFGLARLELAVNDAETARSYIDRLGNEYPASRYLPRASALYADALFDRGELAAALAWYSLVEQGSDPLTQSYASYRKGWCFLKQGALDAARFALGEAVRTAGNGGNWSSNRAVGRQAELDLARIVVPAFH